MSKIKIINEAIKYTELYSVIKKVIEDNSRTIQNACGVNGERIAASIAKAILKEEDSVPKEGGR